MSSEESYLAIQRYLTDEREPYAPGTHGNTKRKIRKAAACYIVRNGILYYQRRQKGLDEFTELEVVLQAERRKELITEAHITSGGEHLNQQQTWEIISQKYWWRGVLKQVKDCIRECSYCQSKQEKGRGNAEDATKQAAVRQARRKTSVCASEEEDDEANDDLDSEQSSAVDKHELVFVDSKGIVKQFLPKHGQTMLDKLNQQRMNNEFCDITLLIEGEEHRAHKAVLASCSDYFYELFVEKGAMSSHEAVVDLSGFSKASFLPLLDFAYTSNLTFNFCVMADVATLARHLLMAEVLQICESVHKKVEEQKLMVYQRGDIHTVVSSQPAPPQPITPTASETYVVTMQSEGTPEEGQSLAVITSEIGTAESLALLAGATVDGETMTVVTHSGQAGSAESLAMVAHSGQAEEGETMTLEPPPPLPSEEEPVEMEGIEDASAADGNKKEEECVDPNKRYLRKRSVKEGGYVRLHMGLENEEEEKSKEPEPVADQPETVEGGALQGDPGGAAEGEHSCNECGLVFHRRYALIMHALKHEKTRSFKCSICNKEFQYAASLRAHLARHKHQKTQRASMTRAMAAEDSQGSEDQTKSRTKREFVCDICGKTLPKLYSLRIHMLNHTGVRPHTCKVCGKSFATKHSLKMHRSLHDSLKRFQCTVCEKSFVTKRSLEEHTSIHTGESKYLCTTCGASFHRASGLSKHLKKHQPRPEVRSFHCSHCDKSFFEAKDLQQHMNKHLGLKPFQCQVCGKCYSWKKDWYSHVKSHTVAEPFRCNVCGKEFFEKALFRRHVKKATHGKKGRVKQNLERECEHCGRKFTQLREYRRHMNNHQGVKPFECLTCGVAWADARSLKRHVRTHTGERPYVCPLCQEAHIDARTLRKHITKFHGDQLPGKIMLEKDTLQFHNQGTQVEHAVSILSSELPPELQPPQPPTTEEIETVLITEETVEAVQAVSEGAVATLSDQSIMQVVNYVLAQQAVVKVEEAPEIIQTLEVEVAHVAEVE
uniref:Zinc finger and BTB domain-containing protein 11-like n=1 Tax=Sinocyclocheilus rhinocerous TaxID=307959 RepID=A0A673H9X4_9TELE